jgi:hypothetical protein
MIKIKKPITLIESDIPVPVKIINYSIKKLKAHILQFLISSMEEEINYIVTKNITTSIHNIDLYKDFLTVLYDQYPKDIPKKEVEQLDDFHIFLIVKDFIDSNYKYELLNDRETLQIDVYLQSNSPEASISGQYSPDSKTIKLYRNILEKYFKTFITRWYQSFHNTQELKRTLNYLWTSYQSILHHELVHFVQFIFMPKVDWFKNSYHGSVTSVDDFSKYISSNVEFFPKLKGEYELFWSQFDKVTNDTFKLYVSHSQFFINLNNYNHEKWQKAIKQFYMLLNQPRIKME